MRPTANEPCEHPRCPACEGGELCCACWLDRMLHVPTTPPKSPGGR